MRRAFGFVLAAIVGLGAMPRAAVAQAYPSARPIRLIVPFPAGSTTDSMIRVIADKMSPALNQRIVVEPMPGGGSVLGTQYVLRQPADGYTLLTITLTAAIKSALARPPYDIRKDLAFVGSFAASPVYLAVNAAVPAKTVPELVAYARANPDKLNISSYGVGTLSHLIAEMFMQSTGAAMTHVPYAGSSANGMALAQGATQVAVDVVSTLRPHEEKGNVRLLAVVAGKRTTERPDVPTLVESGVPIDLRSWIGFTAPAGTPPAVLDRLNRALAVAMRDPAVIAYYERANLALLAEPTSPQEFAAQAGQNVENFAKVIRDRKLDIE